ncbi:hypothetical protein L227DRAFT_578783 [Lentinus tigrinus ALCF2SS1-6]|uniref:Uncharacterized protein n=1 Tax=Lentinus tigrinus ALCF2SS1-6 TaxID=1328759 RepID=A0A5C2RZW3_9APHY|nr:hypothetical protein L227DRAFT_578783 [Lentinus tigrinus ALCF2SS1-6]
MSPSAARLAFSFPVFVTAYRTLSPHPPFSLPFSGTAARAPCCCHQKSRSPSSERQRGYGTLSSEPCLPDADQHCPLPCLFCR